MRTFTRLGVALLFAALLPSAASAANPSLVLKSCVPNAPIANGSFTSKLGDPISFTCTVSNAGSQTENIRISGVRTSAARPTAGDFSTTVLVANIPAGQSVEATVPFDPVLEGGTYQYALSLMGVGTGGKLGDLIGTLLRFTQTIDASSVRIVSAFLDKASYHDGDTAGLSLAYAPSGKSLEGLSVTISLKNKDGSVCSVASMGNPANTGHYAFPFSSGTSCDVYVVEASLVNSASRSVVDAMSIPVTPVSLKAVPSTGTAARAGSSIQTMLMYGAAVLVFLGLGALLYFRNRKAAVTTMLALLFVPMALLAGASSAHAQASCVYSGPVSWGTPSPVCGTTYSGTMVDGGGSTLYNTNPGYTGSAGFSCSNGTWVAGPQTCTATPDCIFNGYAGWGSCGTWGGGTLPNGQSVVVTNTNTGYTGSATYSCNSGTLTLGGNTCIPVVNNCSYSGPVTWGAGCGASYTGTVVNGAYGTIQNTNVGHNGSVTYYCNNGTFTASGSSCDTAAASCTFSATVAWNACYANSSLTIPSGQSTTLTNQAANYNGSATFYCNNGTWSPGVQSCAANTPPANVVDGIPGTTHYSCVSGTLGTTADTATQWQWQCVGTGGGTTTWGTETKPLLACTLPWGGSLSSGLSVTAYQNPSVTPPATCAANDPSQIRTCTNGVLSGSYTNQSCTSLASCTTPWGSTIASGVSVSAFLYPTVTSPATCAANDPYETRTCTNGVLSGSYTNANCTVVSAKVSISAAPTRVKMGGTTVVSWSSTGATSCAITRNGAAWKTGLSSAGVSDTVTAQTVYKITCGALPSKSVTVNVIPGFREF